MAICNTRYGEASHPTQDVPVEVDPSPDVAAGEDKAGGGKTPQADLEGVFLPPLQCGHVSTLCGEEGGGARNSNQGNVGHNLRESQN